MNYLQWFQEGDKIKYIQDINLPSTGDGEKDVRLLQAYLLQSHDQPLSGTDPIGEFYVSGIALSPIFSVIGKGISFLGKKLFTKPLSQTTKNLQKFIGQSTGKVKLTEKEVEKLPKELQKEIQLLKQEGVDITQFTRWDIEKAIQKRKQLLRTVGNDTRIVVTEPTPTGNTGKLYENGREKGRIMTSKNDKQLEVEGIYSSEPKNNIGRNLYDAEVITARQDGLEGIVSGGNLISAEKTTSTLEHFPKKEVIRTDGIRKNSKSNIRSYNNPVYLLKEPSSKVNTKSILFKPSIIDNNGIMRIDLSNPDIYKTILPLWMTLQKPSTDQS